MQFVGLGSNTNTNTNTNITLRAISHHSSFFFFFNYFFTSLFYLFFSFFEFQFMVFNSDDNSLLSDKNTDQLSMVAGTGLQIFYSTIRYFTS